MSRSHAMQPSDIRQEDVREEIHRVLTRYFYTGEPGEHDAIVTATDVLAALSAQTGEPVRDACAETGVLPYAAPLPLPDTAPSPLSTGEVWSCGTCGDADVPEKFRVFGSCYRCAAQRSIDRRERKIKSLRAALAALSQPPAKEQISERIKVPLPAGIDDTPSIRAKMQSSLIEATAKGVRNLAQDDEKSSTLDTARGATEQIRREVIEDDEINYDDPKFNQGVQHVVEMLARALGTEDWVAGDGSEDYDCDLEQTLFNILAAKGLYEKDDGTFASFPLAATEQER